MAQRSANTDNQQPSLDYWAADEEKKCVKHVKTKIDQWFQYLLTNEYMELWNKSFKYYYGGKIRGGRVNRGGDEGEFTVINVNQFRSIIQHLLNLTVGERPAWEPRASNSDVTSMKQTILARGLLDYYMREGRVERDMIQAVENALLFGEGYMVLDWDATKGEEHSVDPDSGQVIKAGNITYTSVEPVDVIRDPRLETMHSRDWLVVRSYINKYNLMKKYPEHAQKISGLQRETDIKTHYRRYNNQAWNSDEIALYTFYHAKTDALPEGRMMTFLDNDVILTDCGLPFQHIPVYRVAASDIKGTPMGFTVGYDLTALQESLDMLFSIVLTNQETFGVQNILVPIGANINNTQIAGGLNFIEYTPGLKPEALELCSTPKEIFEMINIIVQQMETISGVNSVSRGQPNASLKSGAALALIQSMAIQFSQSLQWAYVQMLEDVGTATIQILKEYASIPRVATIVGKNNRSMIQEFSNKDLSNIERVVIDMGNPVSRTVAGKIQLADMMLQAKLITMPDELMQVINTGILEPLTEGKTAELLSIKAENQLLNEGTPCTVILTDDHILHINEHKTVLSDPSSRNDPSIVQTTLDHLQQHIAMLSSPQYSQLMQLMGQPVLPPQPGQPGAPGQPPGPGAGMQPSGPPGGASLAAGAGGAASGSVPGPNPNAQVESHQPNQPSMPKNALTHQSFNTSTGGLQ